MILVTSIVLTLRGEYDVDWTLDYWTAYWTILWKRRTCQSLLPTCQSLWGFAHNKWNSVVFVFLSLANLFMPLRSIHYCNWQNFSLFSGWIIFCYVCACVCNHIFIYSSIDGHLDGFHVFLALWIMLQWTCSWRYLFNIVFFAFFGHSSRSVVAGPYDSLGNVLLLMRVEELWSLQLNLFTFYYFYSFFATNFKVGQKKKIIPSC